MGHRVYESVAGFLAEMSRKLHHHPDKSPESAGSKASPPSPARRALVKAQAVIVFLYISAKKKCTGPKEPEPTMSSADGQSHLRGETSPSPTTHVRKALGKARAVVVLSFVAAKKKLVDVRNRGSGERVTGEARDLDADDGPESGGPGGSKLSTPVRKALVKARAAVASSYRAAKKKAGRKNKQEMAADREEMSGSDTTTVSDDGKQSPAAKQSPLETVKAAVFHTILHARKKKRAATAASGDDRTTIPYETEEEELAGHEFSNSPGSMHSTPKSSTAKTPKSTPTRSPKALFRKVQAAAVLLPFHSRKKASADRPQLVEEELEEDAPLPRESASSEGVVWKKTILMGQKCEPLDFPEETVRFDTEDVDTDHDFSVTASPASMYSTQTSSLTATPDATPARTAPKAVLRKVQAAAVLLPFHLKKKHAERHTVAAETEEEEDDLPPSPSERVSFEGVVWKKTILMGQKCEPLDFPGVIYYDSKGERVDGTPPQRSPVSAVQQQVVGSEQQQQGAFSFPVLVAGTEVNDREWGTDR